MPRLRQGTKEDCDEVFVCCKDPLAKSWLCGPCVRKVSTHGWRGNVCCGFLVLWFSFLVSTTCWVLGGLFWSLAKDDPRGAKIATYNAAVASWVHGGGFQAWSQESAESFSTSTNGSQTTIYVKGFRNETESPLVMRPCSSLAVGDCDFGATRMLLDGFNSWNNELGVTTTRYSDGLIWSATVANAHVAGAAVSGAGSVTLRVPDSETPLADTNAFACDYNRNLVKCARRDMWQEKCGVTEEHVSANRRWLSRISIVKGDADGAGIVLDPCPFQFESKSKAWVTDNNAANDETAENAARALCENSVPDEDIDAHVVLRSKNDPYVVVGALTGCTFNFGLAAENYFGVAITFFVFASLFTTPWLPFVHAVVMDVVSTACKGGRIQHEAQQGGIARAPV